MNKLNIQKTAAPGNDNKKRRKVALIKFGSMAVFAAIVLIFGSIAWFTMNREVGGSGMKMSSSGQNFEVTMLSGSRDGIFKNPYHIAVHDNNAIYWEMTSTNNLNNYNPYVDDEHPGDQGLHPGTEGVISLNVIPKLDSVSLDFDFEVIGYRASTDKINTPDDDTNDELVMIPLSDIADGEGATAQNLLNGHILLFEHRSGTEGNYVYSTPICSNSDMHRIMNRTVSGKNTATQIDIYWVWPNTLSTIVDASASGITAVPFCQDNDVYNYDSYTAITTNLTTYPHYYLKGLTANSIVTASDIGDHYTSYGDMYDQGDNEIGMRVQYLLIKLSVTERTAGGGGS